MLHLSLCLCLGVYVSLVHGILGQMGLSYQKEYRLDCGYLVDIALPDDQVAIEIDGPHHYTKSPHSKAIGKTLLKNHHLMQVGWRLLRISYADWNACKTDQDKIAYLQSPQFQNQKLEF